MYIVKQLLTTFTCCYAILSYHFHHTVYYASTSDLCYTFILVNPNCSFPYTYNGGLYYSCIENMTDVSTDEQPLACLNDAAIPIICGCPGGSF